MRARRIPGEEYCFHREPQLVKGVLGEIGDSFKNIDNRSPVVSFHVHVKNFAVFGFVRGKCMLEFLAFYFHYHVCEHLDEAAVAVVGESWVVGLEGQTFGYLVVEAEVQNSIHHAGHGHGSAGAN